MHDITYNIPLSRLDEFRDSRIIVRLTDPATIPEIRKADPLLVSYVQLMADVFDITSVGRWPFEIPVDIVLTDPENEYPKLYEYSRVFSEVPVRVTIPVKPGFQKAVKLAASLGLAIKLDPNQPEPDLADALQAVLDSYLHHAGVSQPIEYLHSILLAFYHNTPASLWTIQEEDPAVYRYVHDSGVEALSPRFPAGAVSGELGTFLDRFQADLLDHGAECSRCEYFPVCGGYFKWPNAAYRCDGVQRIFRTLRDAAGELRQDAVAFDVTRQGGLQ